MTGPIAVATDFTARADRAIDRALLLGAEWNMPVTLIHALDGEEAETMDRAALDKRMRSVLPEGIRGVEKVEFAYPEGPATRALAEAANAIHASIVVVGPARYNSLKDFFLGTAVDHALRHCEQPMLVVKQRPHRHYQRIVATTDFSAPSARAVELALDWFPEAELHLVHGCHVSYDALQKADYVREDALRDCKERMEKFVAALDAPDAVKAKLTTHATVGSAYETVEQVVAEHDAQLVVIGSHGESGFRHATIGSTANQLLETTLVDTIVVTTPD